MLLASGGSALGATAVSCGGFAMLGGAQINCSHTDPEAPAQVCTFSWALLANAGPIVVQGTFLLVPGTANATIYQGSGFTGAASNPIVLCQGRSR